jgi:hypothetical protein
VYKDIAGSGHGKVYRIMLQDPRSALARLGDYLEAIAGGIVLILLISKYLLKKENNAHDSSPHFEDQFLRALVFFLSIIFASISYKVSAETICRNCGKTMLIKIPLRKQNFPNAVSCWACGAVHGVEWD